MACPGCRLKTPLHEGTVSPKRCKKGWWLLSRSFYSKQHTVGPTVKMGPGFRPPAGKMKPKPTSILFFICLHDSQAENFTASSHPQTARPSPRQTTRFLHLALSATPKFIAKRKAALGRGGE